MTTHWIRFHLKRKLRKLQVRAVGKDRYWTYQYFVNYDWKFYLISWDIMKAKVDQLHRDIAWQDKGSQLIKGL